MSSSTPGSLALICKCCHPPWLQGGHLVGEHRRKAECSVSVSKAGLKSGSETGRGRERMGLALKLLSYWRANGSLGRSVDAISKATVHTPQPQDRLSTYAGESHWQVTEQKSRDPGHAHVAPLLQCTPCLVSSFCSEVDTPDHPCEPQADTAHGFP